MSCDANLSCLGGYCLPIGAGGTSGVAMGSLGGPCYPSNTCDANLSCYSGVCIPSLGAGGSAGSGAGGGGAQGGSFGTAGSQGGSFSTSGSSGTFGTAGSQGGSFSSAGSSGNGASGSGASGSGGTPSTLIVATDGWVGTGTNTVGVVGPWYVYKDTSSTILPQPNGVDFTGAGDKICVTGTSYQTDTYGPTVALNLNQSETATTPGSYVPSAHGVTGFSFDVTGTVPSAIQFSYIGSDASSSEYCTVMFPPKATGNSVLFASTKFQCWMAGGASGSPSLGYSSIHFQVPVNYLANGQSFSFCIANLRAITG